MDLAQRFGTINQINKDVCTYNCIDEKMGMIIENINNQKIKGNVKIKKSLRSYNFYHQGRKI